MNNMYFLLFVFECDKVIQPFYFYFYFYKVNFF